jgi:hypothetical protein
MEFNHIHLREGDEWTCGRSMWIKDQQVLVCEGHDQDEDEACRQCAENVLGHFGDAMHVH